MQAQSNQVLNNLVYDMVTILHSKGEGLQAYDKYMQDAQSEKSQQCVELLQRLKQQDEAAVMEVQQHLSQLMQHGSMSSGQMSGQSSSSQMSSGQMSSGMSGQGRGSDSSSRITQ